MAVYKKHLRYFFRDQFKVIVCVCVCVCVRARSCDLDVRNHKCIQIFFYDIIEEVTIYGVGDGRIVIKC